MHSLKTYDRINRDPNRYHEENAAAAAAEAARVKHPAPEVLQAKHGDRVAARARVNGQPFNEDKISATHVPHMDRIESAIEQPPFITYWARLNERLGRDVGYAEARKSFSGGPSPADALTFIGKEFDGVRAVRGPNTANAKRVYYGEFTRVTETDGIVWHRVSNMDEAPVGYAYPEDAIRAAALVQNGVCGYSKALPKS